MKARLTLSTLIALLILSAGFSQASISSLLKADVIVLDEEGHPIKNAKVEPVSPSINYPSVKTNEKGKARWGYKIQKVSWVTVSKKGYQKVVQVQYSGLPRPVKIILKKDKSKK